MKGLLLFSPLNDVLFMSLDDALSAFINEQARKASLIREEDTLKSVNPDVIVQFFSPLIASQRFMMSEVDNRYNSIRCQNDMIYVFSQIGEHTALAIGSTAEENEEYFQRKLLVFRNLLMLFHGPVLKQLHTVAPANDEKWKLIGQLLSQWEYMYHNEQCFLVEALERISINEDVNAECVKLLESVTVMMRSAGDKHIVHALLFVQAKLLALYSSRYAFELDSGDILLMILIVSNLYPWQPRDGRTSGSGTSAPIPVDERTAAGHKASNHEDIRSREKTTSARSKSGSMAGLTRTSDANSTPKSASSLVNVDESCYQEWTFLDDFQSEALWDVNSLRLHRVKLSSTTDDESGCRTQETRRGAKPKWCDARNETGKLQSGDLEHRSYVLFLRTKHCRHMPVVLHVVRICSGISLVLVSELPKASQAQVLTDALSTVAMATSCYCQPPASVVASVDKIFKKLDQLPKQNRNLTQLRQLHQMVQTKWSVAKDLAQRVKKEEGSSVSKNRLENTLDSITVCLENMFSVMFLQTNAGTEQTERALQQTADAIQNRSRDVILDYKDYLITKASQNVTISSYLDGFPGLVHFIYVDRSTDCMKAPSLDALTSDDRTKRHITPTVQHKIWDVIPWIQTKLSLGFTSLLLHEQHLHFAYFLWYEDAMGNPLVVEQHYRSENGALLPGILADNFYNKLVHDCFPSAANKMSVRCFELFCVHVGLVPTQYVLSHCRKLAARLWESSDVSAPFSIL